MANDRLRLVCKYCGESQMLFKFYPCKMGCPDHGEFARLQGYVASEDRLDDFLTRHIYDCAKRLHEFDLGGDVVFNLVTENAK